MDDFIRRPKRRPIDMAKGAPKPVRAVRPIVVKHTTDEQPVINKLPVRPQLSQQPPKPRTQRPIIDLPERKIYTPPKEDEQPIEIPANAASLRPWFKRVFHKPRNKKQWIILIAILALVGMTIGAAAYWFVIKPSKPIPTTSNTTKKAAVVAPTTEASKLSGLQVPFGVNERPVTAVMIENSAEARPQAGLKEASVVFEAVAEGGITRFNAIYQDTAPDYVGPIRSVRPYYIDWFLPFDAAIAHVGGSPKGLADIKSLGVKDLDQFANGGYYTRISERYAPHNVYSSIAKFNELEEAKGFTSANYEGFTRKKEKALTAATAKDIDLDISSFLYNVHYDYDSKTNSYLRSEGGEAHKDDRSGSQLAPKVVVAVVMQRGIDSDGQHTDYTTIGSGMVFVFQDGGVTQGTWTKDSRSSQWVFTDDAGETIAFNPGQTWISIVDTVGSVTYQP